MTFAKPPNTTSFATGLDIRFVGSVDGRYTFPDADRPLAFACRTASLSPTSVVLAAPVSGALRDHVALRLQHVGLLNGAVSQVVPGGMRIELRGGDEDRRKLAATINWLKKRRLGKAEEKREGARFRPRNARGYLRVEGAEQECFIIDLSSTGCALSARARPDIGTAVIIGNLAGHVVRLFEAGFSVQFDTPQEPAAVEAEATAIRSA